LAATIVYSNNTFHFKSHTTPSSNSHALEIFVSGIPKTQQRPSMIDLLPGQHRGSVTIVALRGFDTYRIERCFRSTRGTRNRARFRGVRTLSISSNTNLQWALHSRRRTRNTKCKLHELQEKQSEEKGMVTKRRTVQCKQVVTAKRIAREERTSEGSKTRLVHQFYFSHALLPSWLLISSPFWGSVSILTSHFVPQLSLLLLPITLMWTFWHPQNLG
jgi:hypothetical protein